MLAVIVVVAAAGAAIPIRSHQTPLIATKRPSPAPLPAVFAQAPRGVRLGVRWLGRCDRRFRQWCTNSRVFIWPVGLLPCLSPTRSA